MIITELKKDAESRNIYSVFLNGEFGFKISEQDLLRLGVYEGREINEEEAVLCRFQAQISCAKAASISYISYKTRTAFEVRRHLQKEFDENVIEEVISFLVENDYLNDKLFAQKYISEKKRLSNLSQKEMIYRLQQKGISSEDIENGLKKAGYNEEIYAKELIRKRFNGYDESKSNKIRAYLFRKGFLADTINNIIHEYKNDI